MKFASVCSGIESATVAWAPLTWAPVFFSEIAPFPRAVLSYHYPHVPNLGDMCDFRSWPDAIFDVLVGGTPCQSFSVAGFRAGFGDPRGNLALVYLEILRRFSPGWFVWENVPGVLSSDEGRDFGSFLGGVAELGYGYAWRTLDAQFFGVPQRRRRVFVVGCFGSWARAAAVLFEPESLRGYFAPGRKAGPLDPGAAAPGARENREFVAGTVPTRSGRFSSEDVSGQLIAGTLSPGAKPGGYNGQDAFAGLLLPFDRAQITHPDNRSRPMPGDPSPTIAATAQPCVAYDGFPDQGEGGSTIFKPTQVAAALRAIDPSRTDRGTRLRTAQGVRRFTPLECERLQGFPDGYTAIPYRGREVAKDAPRYEAIGNAIATPVLRWIGERIEHVEAL